LKGRKRREKINGSSFRGSHRICESKQRFVGIFGFGMMRNWLLEILGDWIGNFCARIEMWWFFVSF
jgi:hypothetical protein